MNFTLPLSLEYIALRKIACTLWNREDVRKSVVRFGKYSPHLNERQRKEEWKKIVDIVMEEIIKFHLPKLLIKKLPSCVDTVGRQILKWLEYHKFILDLGNAQKYLEKLCWTPHGTIDFKKTAEIILNNGDILCIRSRYQIACLCCLEDDIRKLWNEMNEDSRRSYLSNDVYLHCNKWQNNLVAFWSRVMAEGWKNKGKNYTLNYVAALCGNKEPFKFFLRKLSPIKKVGTILNVAIVILAQMKNADICHLNSATLLSENYVDVLCFLLSNMNQDQQIDLFKSHYFAILKCFLVWPLQSFFLEILNRLWNFLDHFMYYNLLQLILNKEENNYKDFNYQKLFDEVWTQGPLALKEYNSKEFFTLLFRLIENEDEIEIKKDKFKFIYKEATPTEKRNSIKELNKLTLRLEKNSVNRFSQLLDDLIQEDNKKRSLEEGDNSVAKRLHINELHAV